MNKEKENIAEAEPDYTSLFQTNVSLEEFRTGLIPHRVFMHCEREILRRIARPGVATILSVIGPTGVGKTQALNEVASFLLGLRKGESDESLAKRPYLPVVYVTASTGRTFESRFKSLLIQILQQVNRVLVEIGSTTGSANETSPTSRPVRPIESLPIARLEELVRVGLRERRVKALLIDEAQHLAQGADAEEWRLVGDGLKLLGSISGTLVVLFGTSELLGLPYLSGQLGRRSKAVHLRRYRWTSQADRDEFQAIVAAFCKGSRGKLPLKVLSENLPLLYTGCVGCVGILSSWLYDAIARAEQTGVEAVDVEILQETAFSEEKLRKIDHEAVQCENAFRRESAGLQGLMADLCNPTKEPTLPSTGPAEYKHKKMRLKPGNRKPTYDPYQVEPALT